MAFDILRQLQYCTGSDYGDNLNMVPSRIIPISLVEDNDDINDNDIIYYVPPRLGNEYVICKPDKKLPEPSAYFRSPNTLLKSFLYLSNIKYYNNVHFPLEADTILNEYLKKIFGKHSKNPEISCKKLTQVILNNTNNNFDTDPNKNPYFSKFIKFITKNEQCDIIIIRSDNNGNYIDTVPSNLPKLSLCENKKVYYVLLQHSNGLFSPYGKAYGNICD